MLVRGRMIALWWLAALACLMASPAIAKVRLVPQLGLTALQPVKLELAPSDSTLLLVVNGHGRIDIFDISIPGLPVKITEIEAAALDASFAPAAATRAEMRIVSSGVDGSVRLWTLDGEEAVPPFNGHKGAVYSVAFSPDGRRIASGGADGTVRLWTLDGREPVAEFDGHDGEVLSVAFSPHDGGRIVSGGSDGTVRVWRLDGEEVVTTPATSGRPWRGSGGGIVGTITSVAVSPNGKLIAAGSTNGRVGLWGIDGESVGGSGRHDFDVLSVAFAPDGKRFASAGADGTVRVWTDDGEEMATFDGHAGAVTTVAFVPDGTRILSGGNDGTVRLWMLDGREADDRFDGLESVYSVAFSPSDTLIASGGSDGVHLWTRDGKEAFDSFRGGSSARSIAFSPTDKLVASGNGDGTIRLWRLDSKESPDPFIGHMGPVLSVSFSPDGTLIVSGGADGTVRLWTLEGREAIAPFGSHDGEVTSVAFSPDGTRIASSGTDGTVKLWSLNGAEVAAFKGHKGAVYSVTFSPDGTRIASGGRDVRLWTLDGKEAAAPFKGHEYAYSVAFSPDGAFIASGGSDGMVRVWTLDGKELTAPLKGHDYAVRSVAFSQDGTRIASGGGDGTVRLWAFGTKEVASPLEGHADTVVSVAYWLGAIRIVSGGSDGAIRLWTLDGKQAVAEFDRHDGEVSIFAVAPDGTHIVSGDPDGTVRVRSLDGHEAVAPLNAYDSEILRVAISPDGTRIGLGAADGTVQLWTPGGRDAVVPLKVHNAEVLSLAFSPGGTHLASGDADGVVRLWTLDSKDPVAEFDGHDGAVSSLAFSPDGSRIASGGADGMVQLSTLDGKEVAIPFEGHDGTVVSLAFTPDGMRLGSRGEDGTVRLSTLDARETQIAHLCSGGDGLGITEDRFVWVNCTDRISIMDPSFEHKGDVFLDREGKFIILHEEGILLPNTRVRDPVRAIDAGGTIDWAPTAVAIVSEKRVRQVLLNEWNLHERVVDIASRTYASVSEWHSKLSILVKAPIWVCIGWTIAALFAAVCWIFIPHKLAHWVMPAVGNPKPPAWRWAAIIFTLLHYLGTMRRPLKKWLRRHWTVLYTTNFGDREPVKERERYCNLGHEVDIVAFADDVATGKRALRWISGVGGSGKSTLAFRMLREATDRKPLVSLPVLIDEDWEGSLTEHVARLLQVGDRAPTPAMVETLGASGCLCLVIDSLSERSMADAIERVDATIRRSVFPAVIITSRQERPSGKTWEAFQTISARPLTPDEVNAYVATYVPEDYGVDIRQRIEPYLTHGQTLSPLFVRFAIEQALKGPLSATSARGLVLRYVEELRGGKLDLGPDDMVRAAEICAREAMRKGPTPREIEPQFLRGVLVAEADRLPFMNTDGTKKVDPAALIGILIGCGLLNRNPINRRLQFAYDPVAELLADGGTVRRFAETAQA